jgi:hypothetical protein
MDPTGMIWLALQPVKLQIEFGDHSMKQNTKLKSDRNKR